MTYLKKYLKEVRERCDAATEGPYHIMKRFNGPCAKDADGFFQICEFNRNMNNWVNDEQFYMSSRQDIPKLLDIIDNQARQIEVLREGLDYYKCDHNPQLVSISGYCHQCRGYIKELEPWPESNQALSKADAIAKEMREG